MEETNFLLVGDKMYAVLTVVLIVFIGLLGFMFFTNRKVSKLEAEVEKMETNKSTSSKTTN